MYAVKYIVTLFDRSNMVFIGFLSVEYFFRAKNVIRV